MSFLKACFLAILATLFLTYVLGSTLTELFDIQIYMENELIEPLKVISLSALVVVFLVVAAIAIVVSVFGSIIFILMLVFGSVLLITIGFSWPILFVCLVVWLIIRDKPAIQCN